MSTFCLPNPARSVHQQIRVCVKMFWNNCALSYATLTAATFSADYRNIAVSGMGIVTGYVKVRAAQVWNRTGPHNEKE